MVIETNSDRRRVWPGVENYPQKACSLLLKVLIQGDKP